MDTRNFLGPCWGLALLLTTSAFGSVPWTWNTIYAPTNVPLHAITYGEGQWVAVGGRAAILVSSNGFQWRQLATGFDPQSFFMSVAYGNGVFVAGGQGSTLRAISQDGLNWTLQATSAASERIYELTFGNGRFVGVGTGASGVSSYILTSTDGVQWTFPVPPSANIPEAVTYGNNLFVAVGQSGMIITSPDGMNWTVRSSGTQNFLRTVAYSGSRFIVAGDAGTALTSTDGISWSPSAPASFAVNGLAGGDGAVVAVGQYVGPQLAEGRLHASDGLTWPGDARTFPELLNAVAYINGHFWAVGHNGLILNSDWTQHFANSWTKSTSGYWEESFWSLGSLPAIWNDEIAVTNAGFKALAIGSGTAANYPQSLKVNYMTVDAPTNSHNLLLLNYAGFSAPLDVLQGLVIGPNGSLLSYYSALKAGSLYLRGQATFAEYGQAQFGNVELSAPSETVPAVLTLSNGWFSANIIEISRGWPGVFNQYGGSNRAQSIYIGDAGTYNFFGGSLDLTWGIGVSAGLDGGYARLNISGGTVRLGGDIGIANWPMPEIGRGQVALSGGSLTSASLSISRGDFSQTGGSHETGSIGVRKNARYDLSAGALLSGRLSVDPEANFLQSGGVHTNAGGIEVNRSYYFGEDSGLYTLNAGRLLTPSISLAGGRFNQTQGTNRTGVLEINRAGEYTLQGGALYASNVVVGDSFYENGEFTHSTGSHVIENTLTLNRGGRYQLLGGTLSVKTIWSDMVGRLWLTGGELQNNEHLILSATALRVKGNWQFGVLVITNQGYTLLGPESLSATTTLRFRDSHSAAWDPNAVLWIANWSGTTNGGTSFRIYVGSNFQGLTGAQLNRVAFLSPGGFPQTDYPARILPTGELVPGQRPSVGYSRSRNSLVLNWPPGHWLMTSTNVAGPYEYLSNTSPYTNLFTDPRCFFLIRSSP